MKLDIVSDLHLTADRDFGRDFIYSWIPEGTVLILAGDVGEAHWWMRGLLLVKELCRKYEHVLWVAGNHDYYHTNIPDGKLRFREYEEKIDNFHFLDQSIIEIDGVKFAGTTLWFKDGARNHLYERYMADFRAVQNFKPEVYKENNRAVNFLKDLPGDIDVVITHHMFSKFSVHDEYKGDPTNIYFLCDVWDLIAPCNPKLAIHGHTHKSFDYMLGDTRVICNPRGYPHENKRDYDKVTVEI